MPTIALPRRPDRVAPFNPPIVAALAPVAVSVLIFSVTRSPFALLFAALGPAVAIAGWIDHRLQRRRTLRRGRARFDTDLAEARTELARLHEDERAELDRRHPGAFAHLHAAPSDPERWRHDLGAPVPLVLGRGEAPSRVEVPLDRGRRDNDEIERNLIALAEEARSLHDAPVTVDARHGLGFVGPPGVTTSALRAAVVQLLSLLDPVRVRMLVPRSPEWDWLRMAPHVRAADTEQLRFLDEEGHVDLVVATATEPDSLPRGCRVVVAVRGTAAELARHPERTPGARLVVDLVSAADAEHHVRALAELAAGSGLLADAALPHDVCLAELPMAARGAGLACTLGLDPLGPVVVDLVTDGPHAVVGGTTGTGKSELLTTWVVSLAREHPPSAVTFLLIDFKGGASFAPVEGLPHVVGVVTDLDAATSRRAIASLRAELRQRERLLAEAGARTIDELAPGEVMPRLVLVVDEFAAVLAEFPDLHEAFVDIAARGRSLGVHLIVCTQRPAGVVRDSLLANCPLRLSLRVTSRADSVALLGVPDAAELPRTPRGRAILSTGEDEPRTMQIALTRRPDIAAVTATVSAGVTRRPWLEPLPAVLPLDALPSHAHGLAFGLLDVPEDQDQPRALLTGNTLVLGTRGAGRTTLLDTLERQARRRAVRVGGGIEQAWDVLTALADGAAAAELVLVDDVDALLARAGEEHRAALAEAITRLLRDATGTAVVLTAQRLAGVVLGFAALCPHRVLLRLADRQEHHAAGGRPREWDGGSPPGAGWYDGRRVQVAIDTGHPRGRESPERGRHELAPLHLPLTVVSRRARALAAAFADRLPVGTPGAPVTSTPYSVTIADPETWQTEARAFAAARERGGVLFDRCTLADLRILARTRELPPLVDSRAGTGWLLQPDGSVRRSALPPWVADVLAQRAGPATDPVVPTEQKGSGTGDRPLIS